MGRDMFNKLSAIILLLSSSFVVAEETYTAVISCGVNGQHTNVLACFTDTDLKITKKNSSIAYDAYQLQGLGQAHQDGLHIRLPESFQIEAHSSQDTFVLGVKILNEKNEVVFDYQADKWGVILVKSWRQKQAQVLISNV